MCAWRGGTEAPGTTWSRSFTRPACPGTGGLNGASGSGPYGVGKVFAITGVGGAPSRRSGLPTSSPSSPSCTTPPLTMLPDGPPLQPPTPQAQLPVSWTTTWCGNSAGEEVDHLRAILKVRGESLPGEGGGPGHQHHHGAAQPHKHREEGAESCDGQETLDWDIASIIDDWLLYRLRGEGEQFVEVPVGDRAAVPCRLGTPRPSRRAGRTPPSTWWPCW